MDCTIGQILQVYLLYKDQEYWPNYVTVTEMALNFIINVCISKAPFEIIYGKNILFPVYLLLSRESTLQHTSLLGRCKS